VIAEETWENISRENIQEIRIPYEPRPFQSVLHQSLSRFNLLVCHRRFGKTVFSIMEMVDRALRNDRQNPQYAYIAPTYGQAKRVAWEYLKYYCSFLPDAKANEADLRIDVVRDRPDGTKDKIRFMLLGAENPDTLRGIYLDGAILDEYAQCPVSLWGEIIRPALSDRKGWAIFIGTPKGTNHFFEMYQIARQLMQDGKNWFAAVYKASETGVLDDEELDDARATMSPEEFEQEYECSWSAALKGAYYGEYINQMEAEGRITNFALDPNYPIRTVWDLGISDSMAIWMYQIVGREVRIYDYFEDSGKGLEHYVHEIQRRGYLLDHRGHALPHDGAAKELGTGKSRQEQLEIYGIRAHVLPRHGFADGIHAVRTLLKRPTVYIHRTNCARGVDALRNYTRKFDRAKGLFLDQPNHNWASHGADAFRYLALDLDDPHSSIMDIQPEHRRTVSSYDEFGD
jgi:phage terminase large subunit